MKRFLFLLIVILPVWLSAQQSDTTQLKTIQALEEQIDSLRQTLRFMDNEMQKMKQSVINSTTDIDEVLAFLEEDEDPEEAANFEVRSRYKRIDDLLRAIEQRPGRLMFNGNLTAINQFAFHNNNDKAFGTASFDLFATTSFGKGTLLFVDMETIGGNGPDMAYPTFSHWNADAGSTQSADGIDRLNVLEAWGEFSLFKDIITVTVGKIDVTNYFDNNAYANDETMQFINNAFVNSAAFAVPSNAPGIRFRTSLFNRYYIQFGIASQKNAGAELFDRLYKVASIGWTLAPDSDFESHIHLYGYQMPDTNRYEVYGFGISMDKAISNQLHFFGRYGLNQDRIIGHWDIRAAWSAGLGWKKRIKKRPLVVGLAYGENLPANTSLETEKVTELYIRRQINKWAHISPHFQRVWNRMGTKEVVSVVGVRAHFNF